MIFICSIISVISLYILFLFFRFSGFNFCFDSHNELENLWTLIPSFVLLSISFPSLVRLFFVESCIFCGVTLKIIAHQWYWSYSVIDYSFDSYMVYDSFLRLLETDNNLVVPNNTPIRCLVSSSDVIHSWSIPSMGVKVDAIPGRVGQTCFVIKKIGVFYGQCSEICGANHSFMPISLERIPSSFFC